MKREIYEEAAASRLHDLHMRSEPLQLDDGDADDLPTIPAQTLRHHHSLRGMPVSPYVDDVYHDHDRVSDVNYEDAEIDEKQHQSPQQNQNLSRSTATDTRHMHAEHLRNGSPDDEHEGHKRHRQSQHYSASDDEDEDEDEKLVRRERHSIEMQSQPPPAKKYLMVSMVDDDDDADDDDENDDDDDGVGGEHLALDKQPASNDDSYYRMLCKVMLDQSSSVGHDSGDGIGPLPLAKQQSSVRSINSSVAVPEQSRKMQMLSPTTIGSKVQITRKRPSASEVSESRQTGKSFVTYVEERKQIEVSDNNDVDDGLDDDNHVDDEEQGDDEDDENDDFSDIDMEVEQQKMPLAMKPKYRNVHSDSQTIVEPSDIFAVDGEQLTLISNDN